MRFFITFPQRLPSKNHYQEIEADDYDEARRLAFKHYGQMFAFMYTEKEFLPQIERFGLEPILPIIRS